MSEQNKPVEVVPSVRGIRRPRIIETRQPEQKKEKAKDTFATLAELAGNK